MSEKLEKQVIIGKTKIYNDFIFKDVENSWKWFDTSEISIKDEETPDCTKKLQFYNNPTNCKLFIVDGLNNLDYLQRNYPQYFNTIIEILNSKPSSTFFVHVTDKNTVDLLSEHFITVFTKTVFIRGVNTPQYHALFMNKDSRLKDALEKYQKGVENPVITKKELVKLANYKQEKRKKEFLEKLIKRYE